MLAMTPEQFLTPNLRELGISRVVALDFETFYDPPNGYGLKTMTTEQYVRDERFEVICMTATADGVTVYEAWGADDCLALMKQMGCDRKDTMTVAHNARFDGCVAEMALKFNINMLVCTMHMMRITGLSRLIGESLDSLSRFLVKKGYKLPYKGHEVENAVGLHLVDMSQNFRLRYMNYCRKDTIILFLAAMILVGECPADTLRASDMTLKMYTRPAIQLDQPMLKAYLEAQYKTRQEKLHELAKRYSHGDVVAFVKILRSKPKLAALLIDLGVEPPMKESVKKTETKRANLADPAWVAKTKTDKFLAQLMQKGMTWDEWAAEPVMEYAFAMKDTEFMELENHHNPYVAAVITARMENNTSQAESRTKRFIDCSERGLFVFALQYAKAHTHRYGADDKLNQQNLPKHKGDKTLRFSMRAPDGYEIGGADSSQVEARCLAYAAQETKLLTIFETGGDPYSFMAEILYGEPADEIRKWAKMDSHGLVGDDLKRQADLFFMRFMGKKVILGSGYQMSGNKFALTLRQEGVTLKPSREQIQQWLVCQPDTVKTNRKVLELEFREFLHDFHVKESKRINWIYRTTYQKIVGFWDMCDWVLSKLVAGEQGYFGGPDGMLFYFDGKHTTFGEPTPGVMMPNGEWIIYPYLEQYKEDDTGWVKYRFQFRKGNNFVPKNIYGGSMTENLIQMLAFCILTWQAVRIQQVIPVKGNVHDEWFSIYRKELRPKVKAVYEMAMRTVPPWIPGVPLDCEFTAGETYGDM